MLNFVVWTNGDTEAFEKSVPIVWNGKFLRSRGWENGINVVFIAGFPGDNHPYILEVKQLGYNVIDASQMALDILKNFPELDQLTTLLKYWFLRWYILEQLMFETNQKTIVHLDSDIALTVPPSDLCSEFEGRTLVMQGCPAFTAITDPNWFRSFDLGLREYLSNPEQMKSNMIEEKRCKGDFDRVLWNQLSFSEGSVVHDQYLIQYLISAGRLPQDKDLKARPFKYFWIQNPIFPLEWAEEQNVKSRVFSLEGHTGNHKLGFKTLGPYHFQTDFAYLVDLFLKLRRVRVGWMIRYFHYMRPNSKLSKLAFLAIKLLIRVKLVGSGGRRLALQRSLCVGDQLGEFDPKNDTLPLLLNYLK